MAAGRGGGGVSALAGMPGSASPSPASSRGAPSITASSTYGQPKALADLIDAETEAQRRQALRADAAARCGALRGLAAELVQRCACRSRHRLSRRGRRAQRTPRLARARDGRWLAEIAAHLDDGHRGEIMREGFRVVLTGAPNAGKSSLLNALARRDAAIVSAEAGTTRDVIEVRLDLGGLPVIVRTRRASANREGRREGRHPPHTRPRPRRRSRVVAQRCISAARLGAT